MQVPVPHIRRCGTRVRDRRGVPAGAAAGQGRGLLLRVTTLLHKRRARAQHPAAGAARKRHPERDRPSRRSRAPADLP